MHKDWCGKSCSECRNPCELDESIPCSPDCECLGENGEMNCDECRSCDAIAGRYYDYHKEEFETILDYDYFQVVLHKESGCYYFLEKCDEYERDCYEVELCAVLRYDICHDLMVDDNDAGMIMSDLFECDCCGERVTDDHIEYLWFKQN